MSGVDDIWPAMINYFKGARARGVYSAKEVIQTMTGAPEKAYTTDELRAPRLNGLRRLDR